MTLTRDQVKERVLTGRGTALTRVRAVKVVLVGTKLQPEHGAKSLGAGLIKNGAGLQMIRIGLLVVGKDGIARKCGIRAQENGTNPGMMRGMRIMGPHRPKVLGVNLPARGCVQLITVTEALSQFVIEELEEVLVIEEEKGRRVKEEGTTVTNSI